MHRSKLVFVVSAAVVALAFGGAACGKDKKSRKKTEPTTDSPPVTDTPPAGGTGTVSGKVDFTGTAPKMPALGRDADPFCAKTAMNAETVLVNANNTLANVLVRIKPGSVKGAAPTAPVSVGQDNCMYRPRVQGAMANQQIKIHNGDPTTHNVHAFDMRAGEGEESLYNLAQPKGAADIDKDANGYEVVKFKCDVHPWMLGYVVVSDHPFFAVTGDTGEFKLEGVPAGKHTIEAWHEHYGMKTADVNVAKDGTAEVKFTYDAGEKPI